MPGQPPAQRAIAIAAVVLLHLVLVWFLLRATIVEITPPAFFRELPITIWLQTSPTPKPPEPKAKEKKKEEGAVPVERAIGERI